MKFRGLPPALNCGNVELTLIGSVPSTINPCGSCDFVHADYLSLNCGHNTCESCCLLIFDEESDDGLYHPDLLVKCAECNEIVHAQRKKITTAQFGGLSLQCPCSFEGSLRDISRHRRSCNVQSLKLTNTSESLDDSISQCSSSHNRSPAGSFNISQPRNSLQVDTVKEIMLEGLNRVEEEIYNRVVVRLLPTEGDIERLTNRVQLLEARLNVNTNMQNRVRILEEGLTRVQALQMNPPEVRDVEERLTRLEQSMNDRPSMAASAADSNEIIRSHIYNTHVWFNVKELLQTFNRSQGNDNSSEAVEILVGGYPLSVSLQLDWVDGVKWLAVYAQASDGQEIAVRADWPMRRTITFRIYTETGSVFSQSELESTNEARMIFSDPYKFEIDEGFGVDLCTVQDLTKTSFYRRQHGMVCVGVQVSP